MVVCQLSWHLNCQENIELIVLKVLGAFYSDQMCAAVSLLLM